MLTYKVLFSVTAAGEERQIHFVINENGVVTRAERSTLLNRITELPELLIW